MVAVKLGLSRNGLAPSFYRRVSVETNETGVDLLKRQAVLLFQGNESGEAHSVDLGSFAVTLFYVDSDGDKVLICNESDLTEAIEEGQSHLRAVIKVHAQVTLSAPASTKSTQTFVRTCETGTQPATGTVVDALADLVHSVAVTAQAGVEAAAQAAQEAHREQKLEAKKSMQEAKKSMQEARAEMKRAKAASKEQIKAATRQVKESVKAAKMSANVVHGKRSWDAPKELAPVVKVAPSFQQNKASKPAEEDTPFIHGRHTCDICLTSPIVGKRFHATNLPDYDLCGACHDSYKGKDITFEETVLDRDRSLQERWSKKYSRMLQIDANQRRGRRTGCHTAPRRCPEPRGPPHFPGHGPFGHRFPPPHGHHHAPPPHGHPHAPPPFAPRAPPPFAPPPPYAPPQSGRPSYVNPVPTPFDAALAEAMRRSLEEAATERSVATTEESEETTRAPLDHSGEAVKSVVPIATSDDSFTEPEPIVVEDVVEDEEEASEVEPAQEPEPVIEEVEPAQEPEPVVEEAEAAQEAPAEDLKTEDAPSDEVISMEDDKPEAEEESRKTSESFSSDAVDSGSVAAFMGETLDRFSAAIDSLNSEMGATIVDGDAEDDAVSKDDSWSVVEDEQIAYDENLARAAVMIGSALFNSDNQGVSDSTSHISSITSVPSEMPSFTEGQASRWASQLAQLHDMNLHDDAKYIEVMEMLAAANIGSNEDEEITVTQVLNHTLDA